MIAIPSTHAYVVVREMERVLVLVLVQGMEEPPPLQKQGCDEGTSPLHFTEQVSSR